LYQEVREKQAVAHHIDAWTYSPGSTGLLGISAVMDAEEFTATRDAVIAEVEKIKSTSVSADEINKAVKQFVSATLSSRKTMDGQAGDLGSSWLAASDLTFSERYLAAVKRVTPADVQRVARQYLTPENRTLYALLPEGTTPKAAAVSEISSDEPIQKFELPNGLRLLVKENHRLPFVEFRMAFQGGVLAETTRTNGVTQLMAKTLIKGTSRRSAEDLAREIESVGGSLDSYAGNQSFGANAEVLSSDFATGLELLADVILNPTFPADAFEREREVQIANLEARKDDLLKSASVAMRRRLFGDASYGLDILGTEESVSALKAEDLKAHHQKFAVPNNCVLAIYGDVKTADVKAAVEKTFGAWKKGSAVQPSTPAPRPSSSNRVEESRDKKQAVMVVGFPGTTLHSEDRYALEMIQEACSDLGSRLFMRVREQMGLAYYVGAQHFPGLAPGYFAFYVGTMPEKVELVEKELLREAELLRAEGLTEAELKRAKAKIIGQKKIARQDLGHLASATALDELYGLGYQHLDAEDALYEAVTLEQVKAAAIKYLKPESVVISVIKPD
jgi:zinc protease